MLPSSSGRRPVRDRVPSRPAAFDPSNPFLWLHAAASCGSFAQHTTSGQSIASRPPRWELERAVRDVRAGFDERADCLRRRKRVEPPGHWPTSSRREPRRARPHRPDLVRLWRRCVKSAAAIRMPIRLRSKPRIKCAPQVFAWQTRRSASGSIASLASQVTILKETAQRNHRDDAEAAACALCALDR